MKRLSIVALVLVYALPAWAQENTPSSEGLEFFEKKIRPVLADQCYSCHSASAKKLKAGLRLDSRARMLEGGDNGPVLVPGQPDKSLLIEAIRYKNVDLKMPPETRLPDGVIADFVAWVAMGAPWPHEKEVNKVASAEFDLQKRKKDHWAWQPIRPVAPPNVKDADWPLSAIDRFLLAPLEAKALRPAPPADPRTLLRRLYFDIVGLPPSRQDVEAFVKAWDAPNAQQRKVLEQWVDRLLASPQFGERWGRHWLDLVRYAESRGHEFDYTIPNAFQYRDYVIRALNADVPYNQFVHEHIAGDLIKEPRLHPTEGFNESILGTAFWFLGEEIHSPVDIRQDQADRFDNRIDVMTKTFLGLTVSCARCHDHKFDAISAKDYYALFGVLESCNYRLARFDTMTHNRKIAESLLELRNRSGRTLKGAMLDAMMPTVKLADKYLLTAAGAEDYSAKLDPILLQHWKGALGYAAKDESSPFHTFAKAAADKSRSVPEVLKTISRRYPPGLWPHLFELKDVEFIANYWLRYTKEWLTDDVTFGLEPVRRGDVILGVSPERPILRIVTENAAELDRTWDKTRLTPGTQNESGALGGAMRPGRTLRTPEFTLKHDMAFALVKGSGTIYASVGAHIMISGPLHGGLVQRFSTSDKFQWVSVNLKPYKGQRVHLEFTPNAGTDFALMAVVQAAKSPLLTSETLEPFEEKTLNDLAKTTSETLLRVILNRLLEAKGFGEGDFSQSELEQANWLIHHASLFIKQGSDEEKQLVAIATPIIDQQKKLLARIKLESRLAPAMQDGSGTDECVFTRGNPKTLGALAPRRFLEALSGPDGLKVESGSGRLELAKQMTDPTVTPFITRVYVNRVWHHLFGRGIVGSVDNFGVLGQAPTHPELLDHLADRFAKEGWSTKKLIRELVLTRAYQMSSHPDENADQADPENLLLHRMRLRRLEGEAIRDSILKVSGRLNPAMYGPSVPVYLTPFQDGRGRPASGPLDGDGRRSIYLGVRRNFLSPFLLAFDTPSPFSTVGRRSVSNVPAQALILMNDPFVHGQAEVWAKRVVAENATDEERVRGMYLDAFARPPNEAELRSCLSYLESTPESRRWADLAHVLFNTKEFYFVD